MEIFYIGNNYLSMPKALELKLSFCRGLDSIPQYRLIEMPLLVLKLCLRQKSENFKYTGWEFIVGRLELSASAP
jgi:hypothetical protein